MKTINVLLFKNFAILDALSPAEVFGQLSDEYQINIFRSMEE